MNIKKMTTVSILFWLVICFLIACERSGTTSSALPGGTDTPSEQDNNDNTGDDDDDNDNIDNADTVDDNDTDDDNTGDDDDNNTDAEDSVDCTDEDNDWWCLPLDCDDTNPDVHPSAVEILDNGIDDDCDGETDEELDTGDPSTDTEEIPLIPQTCQQAASGFTSVGCEFFTADLDMSTWDEKLHALIISNPQETQTVTVTIENGVGTVLSDSIEVDPLQLEVVYLSCEDGDADCLSPSSQVDIQGIGKAKGFHITSDFPVSLYQFNTFGVQVFSSDASLLFPVTSLSGNYIVGSWKTGTWTSGAPSLYPTQFTVVATEDNTKVKFVPSVDVGENGGLGPYPAGQVTEEIPLDTADILAIASQTDQNDLTGTKIVADKPVVVFGSHPGGGVPTEASAQDHLEEQLMPLESWGSEVAMARYDSRRESNDDDLVMWRVVAGNDDMTVTFDPPLPEPFGSSHHFNKQGDYIEVFAAQNTYAVGRLDNPADSTKPEASLLAFQLMSGGSTVGGMGDPMMLQASPVGQFLPRYVFITDNVYNADFDYIILVREAGVPIELDCAGTLPDHIFTPMGSSGYEAGVFYIDNPEDNTGCEDGPHVISSNAGFGLSVVGTGDYQSYGYLGGMGFKSINPDPIIILE